MIFTAWSNGSNGFGFKISVADREACFSKSWKQVLLELPTDNGFESISINISPSFWRRCRELRSARIGAWFRASGYFPWERGKPPRFHAKFVNQNTICVVRNTEQI